MYALVADVWTNAAFRSPEDLDVVRMLVGVGCHTVPMAERVQTLDSSVLSALGNDLGGDLIVIELVEMFLDELPGRTREILDGDRDDAIRAAHTLKSSARLLGAFALADDCAGIEVDGAPTAEIQALSTATDEALRQWIAGCRHRDP